MTLDASASDPDGEPEGDFSFSWRCAPPPPGTFDGAPLGGGGGGGCLAADGTPLGTDLGGGVGSNGSAVQLALLGSPAGANYTVTVTASKGFRSASASAWLVVFSGRGALPAVSIEPLAAPKANPAQKLTLRASVRPSAPGLPVATSWSISSPARFKNLLEQPGVLATPATSASLVVNPGTLPPGNTLVFSLAALDAGGAASASVAVPVAGAPHRRGAPGLPGLVAVSPESGAGLKTPFTLTASEWDDAADPPLTYAFYYQVFGGSSDAAAAPPRPVALSGFQPQPRLAGVLLPAGATAGNFTLSVTCAAQDALGVVSVSAPALVRVTWAPGVLEDPAALAVLAGSQAAGARARVLSGEPEAALGLVSGIGSLLNARPRQPDVPGGGSGGEIDDDAAAALASAMVAREGLLELLEDIAAVAVPSAAALEALAGAAAAVASEPRELSPAAQGSAIAVLGAVAAGGTLVSGTAANASAEGLSAAAEAAALAATPQARGRLLAVGRALRGGAEPAHPPPAWLQQRRALLAAGALVRPRAPLPLRRARLQPPAAGAGLLQQQRRRALAASAPSPPPPLLSPLAASAGDAAPPKRVLWAEDAPAIDAAAPAAPALPIARAPPPPPPTPAPPAAAPPTTRRARALSALPPAASPAPPPAAPFPPAPPFPPTAPPGSRRTAATVVAVLEALHSSLQESFSVPGEAGAVLSAPYIRMVSQLDSPGPGSRLFSQRLSTPGAAAGFAPLPPGLFAGVGAAAVRTQFLALKFKCVLTAHGDDALPPHVLHLLWAPSSARGVSASAHY